MMSATEQPSIAPPTGDMSAAEFRRFGHQIVDWIANYFEHIEDLPVLAQIEPGDLKAQLPSSPPSHGEAMETILADIDRLCIGPITLFYRQGDYYSRFRSARSAQDSVRQRVSYGGEGAGRSS